jgi:IS6 family transposase
MRWVHQFAPEIDERNRPFLKQTNDSYRADETYIKVKGHWKYLYRAVDSKGNTIDFMLSEIGIFKQRSAFLRRCYLHHTINLRV